LFLTTLIVITVHIRAPVEHGERTESEQTSQ